MKSREREREKEKSLAPFIRSLFGTSVVTDKFDFGWVGVTFRKKICCLVTVLSQYKNKSP